jgi:Zn ribbon nucleic-acid-binding protein
MISANCPNCQSKREMLRLDINNLSACMICGYTGEVGAAGENEFYLVSSKTTYAETIGILDDLKAEFALLETIRETAKEYIELFDNAATTDKNYDSMVWKLDELRHLVKTD